MWLNKDGALSPDAHAILHAGSCKIWDKEHHIVFDWNEANVAVDGKNLSYNYGITVIDATTQELCA